MHFAMHALGYMVLISLSSCTLVEQYYHLHVNCDSIVKKKIGEEGEGGPESFLS